MNIHIYIHVLLKKNFFALNYNGTRSYRKIVDTGHLICELNNYFRKDYIYE